MKTREEIRQEIIDLKRKFMLLALPTGLGKSKIALDVVFNRGPLLPKVLIVYPKVNLKKNWIEEIKKWGYEAHLSDISFTTYNSLHKFAGEDWDAVIFDEGHHITERVLDIIKCMKIHSALVLSATVKPSLRYRLEIVFPGMYNYRVKMKDAIDSEILPDPRIVLFPMTLSVVGQTETIIKNPKAEREVLVEFNKRFMCKDKNTKYIIPCTEAQYLLDLDSQIEWFKTKVTNGSQSMKNIWLHKAGERLKWLAAKKNKFVIELLKVLQSERTLTFCTSIEQTKDLGSSCIHSKNKDALAILDKFNEGKINHITAVAMLDEGINLVDCRVGIFANINSSERIQIQRLGRLLRHKNPIIIIPYFKNSREQEIIDEMLAGYNPELIVTYESISDLQL